MSDNPKLTQEEVAALIDGLNSGTLTSETNKGDHVDYKPFVFGDEDTALLGDMHSLRLINDRFSRQFRNVLLPMLRLTPRITTQAPESMRYEDHTAKVEGFTSLTTAHADRLKDQILIHVQPRMISLLVNSFFGGKGDIDITRQSEFTPTEEKILENVINGIVTTLEESWREIFPLNFTVISSETNKAFSSFVEPQENVIVNEFVVHLPFAKSCTIYIVYPRQAMKQIAGILRSKIQRSGDRHDEKWEKALHEAVLNIPLKFVPRIAEPKINLGELMNIEEGMVVEIPAFEKVSIFVAGQPMFTASIGDRDGKYAVRILN
jgi:flagellar motor switch protein FliM